MSNSNRRAEWEDRRRAHLTTLIALLMAISSASLAFLFSLLSNETITWGGYRTSTFLASNLLFFAVLAANLLSAYTRLQDARITAMIVHDANNSKNSNARSLLRKKARMFSKATWILLGIQAWCFGIGTPFLMVLLFEIYKTKLFP